LRLRRGQKIPLAGDYFLDVFLSLGQSGTRNDKLFWFGAGPFRGKKKSRPALLMGNISGEPSATITGEGVSLRRSLLKSVETV